ncbi:hypothetical protein MFLAVUS_000094 [Mucor flavus]|uniref:Uncharacterized protein n=1 Tax=Mucor flavus TaxID=439312 RepID=A0ABP9YIS3_9FUNG
MRFAQLLWAPPIQVVKVVNTEGQLGEFKWCFLYELVGFPCVMYHFWVSLVEYHQGKIYLSTVFAKEDIVKLALGEVIAAVN